MHVVIGKETKWRSPDFDRFLILSRYSLFGLLARIPLWLAWTLLGVWKKGKGHWMFSIFSTQQAALTSAHRSLLALRLLSSSATILPIDRPLLSRDLLKKLSKKLNAKGHYRWSEEHEAACQAGERCTVVGAEKDQWSMQRIFFWILAALYISG